MSRMFDVPVSGEELFRLGLRLAAFTTLSYLSLKVLLITLDPTRKQRQAAKERAKILMSRWVSTVKDQTNRFSYHQTRYKA